MERVTVTKTVAVPLDAVWRTITDIEAYPRYMENVQSVHVLQDGQDGRVAAWEVLLRGSVLKWTERGFLDETSKTIRFEQVDGDLAEFRGTWTVRETADGVAVEFDVEFEIGIPLLARMLTPVARESLRDNALTMLQAVQARAASR